MRVLDFQGLLVETLETYRIALLLSGLHFFLAVTGLRADRLAPWRSTLLSTTGAWAFYIWAITTVLDAYLFQFGWHEHSPYLPYLALIGLKSMLCLFVIGALAIPGLAICRARQILGLSVFAVGVTVVTVVTDVLFVLWVYAE